MHLLYVPLAYKLKQTSLFGSLIPPLVRVLMGYDLVVSTTSY